MVAIANQQNALSDKQRECIKQILPKLGDDVFDRLCKKIEAAVWVDEVSRNESQYRASDLARLHGYLKKARALIASKPSMGGNLDTQFWQRNGRDEVLQRYGDAERARVKRSLPDDPSEAQIMTLIYTSGSATLIERLANTVDAWCQMEKSIPRAKKTQRHVDLVAMLAYFFDRNIVEYRVSSAEDSVFYRLACYLFPSVLNLSIEDPRRHVRAGIEHWEKWRDALLRDKAE